MKVTGSVEVAGGAPRSACRVVKFRARQRAGPVGEAPGYEHISAGE